MPKITLVSCAKTKKDQAAPACELYNSSLFHKSRVYAESEADQWYILSAKHYLLAPNQVVEPYEQTLNTMPKTERKQWARKVFEWLASCTDPADTIVLLAGRRYCEVLLPLLKERGHPIEEPMKGLSQGKRLQWLNQKMEPDSRRELEEFYDLMSRLRSVNGGGRILGECTGRDGWPERGVYFIFEQGETRSSSPSIPRVVRVGTHMVSRGTKSTLWGRLRQHRGNRKDGGGNHRGSVFRRHVGEALIRKTGEEKCFPEWGLGNHASREIKLKEKLLELKVSKTIGRMDILWLAIPDEAGPKSDRAVIEKNAIGLLSKIGCHIDPPSPNWLGRSSSSNAITNSGLWNVDHTNHSFDVNFLQLLAFYIDAKIHETVANN